MFNSSKLDRFAIRKYAVGVCSVVVASLLFLGPAVSADQLVSTPGSEPVATNSESSLELVAEGKNTSGPATLPKESSLSVAAVTNSSQETVPTAKTESSQVLPEEASEAPEPEKGSENSKTVGEIESEPVETHKEESDKTNQEGVESQAASSPSYSTEILPEPPKLAPAKFSSGTAFRSFGMTRSATPAGVIGDDYPTKWKYSDPESDLDSWNLFVRNCTSFAAYRLSSVNGIELPVAYGNAKEWGGRARSEGYRVDNTPVRGAVAWSEAAAENKWWGHVAWVAAVNGDMVTVEEYNYGNHHAYNLRTVHKSAFTAYIHFKDIGQSSFGSEPNTSSSMGTIHGLPAQGSYTFTQRTGVKNEPKLASPDRATYGVGETVNYDKVLESDNHVWISYMNYSGSRSYIAVKALSPNPVSATPGTRPTTGTINIQNQNPRTGDFDVIISNAYHVGGIQEVQVPIWSDKGGQDDIVWYRAQHQGGSTYKVSVQTSRHKNDTGTYHVHLYYVQNDGKQVGAGATSTEVTRQQVSSMTIAPSGVYHFTKTLPIKNQASMASPTLDYYYAGETVNYDRVLTAEGRQWLSYLSHGGARRYIPLN